MAPATFPVAGAFVIPAVNKLTQVFPYNGTADRSGKKAGPQGMPKKIVKNFALDQDLIEALQRLSAAQQESMSLIVREALRSHIQAHKSSARSGASS